MALTIVWGNIVDEKADVLVTPANRFPRVGRGLDSVVHEAAGPELLKARKRLGEIGPGIVKVSPAFGLAGRIGARHIIHALGPVYETGCRNEALVLDGCYLHILMEAASLGARVVSLPVLSSGRFGMPMEMAMDTAVGAIETYLRLNRGMSVKLVVIDEAFYNYALRKWPGRCVKRFTRAQEAAYRKSHPVVALTEALASEEELPDEETLEYFRGVKVRLDERDAQSFNALFGKLWTRVKHRERKAYKDASRGHRSACRHDYLLSNQSLSDRSGVTVSSIKHFCSSAKSIRPSKAKVIALAVAMRLELAYVDALLKSAGYRLDESERNRLMNGTRSLLPNP